MNKYEILIKKLNALPPNATLVVVVDSLSKVQDFVKELLPMLKGYTLMGQEHRIYFSMHRTCIKFVTIGTLFILGNLFITGDKEIDSYAKKSLDILEDKDVNPLIVLDVKEIPDHEFGTFVSINDAMATFELLNINKVVKGEATAYKIGGEARKQISSLDESFRKREDAKFENFTKELDYGL